MPPGFGLLDAALISIPVGLLLLGLIRGAPVELASCVGCLVGVFAAWLISAVAPAQEFGPTVAPLIALGTGLIAWRMARGLSRRLGLDTRWVSLGGLFDSCAGGVMGGLRGVAMVSAGCLAYAVIFVPLGFANALDTVSYPVFLSVGSRVTSAALAVAPSTPSPGIAGSQSNFASVPLPLTMPRIPSDGAPSRSAPPVQTVSSGPGPGLAALIHAVAPGALAGTVATPIRPIPAYHSDFPVRSVPVSLIETHHNILHPRGIGSVARVVPSRFRSGTSTDGRTAR